MQSGLPYKNNDLKVSHRTQLKKIKFGRKPNSSLANNPQTYYHQKNINDQLMTQYKRKQNYLNSKYNQRLTNLKKITNDNKKIYKRLNSQKSLYSQKEQRKSYESIKSLSRCSSRSSKSRDDKSKTQRNRFNRKPKKSEQITIQSESINQVKKSKLTDFQRIFMNQENSDRFVNKASNRSMSMRVQKKGEGMGNMLHRIAEEMLRSKPMKMLY